MLTRAISDDKSSVDAAYVLITPAKNEQQFVGKTIESVLAQSVLPREWIIVSDGSTDNTDQIVQEYCRDNPFLRLVRVESGKSRNFAAKVAAFQRGLDAVADKSYKFIGNLDADVSFASDYFEQLLLKFGQRGTLGLAGGLILENCGDVFVPQAIHRYSVAGAVQLFRRRCFEQIGGYTPVRAGGIDTVAEIKARMHGWEVETFSDLQVLHHRRIQTGSSNIVATRFRQGANHSRLGYHPLFQVLSSISRVQDRPYCIGAALVLAGYCWASFRYPDKVLPPHVVKFLRKEQWERVRALREELTNRIGAVARL